MIWHNSEVKEVLTELQVDPEKGLLSGVADERLSIFGYNTATQSHKTSLFKCFLNALQNKWIYILSVISVLSVIVGYIYKQNNPLSPLVIIAVILLNALVTAFHSYRSESSFYNINARLHPTVLVLRDGIEKKIKSNLIVPGDILILKPGDYITADARVIESSALRINETALTGISVPADKHPNDLHEDIAPIVKRSNMVFSGTSVLAGSGKAVVVETGYYTEIGKTNEMIKHTNSEELPIENALKSVGNIINITVLIFCIIAFLIGIIRNLRTSLPFAVLTVNTLLDSVALGIAAIPESITTIAATVVALGIERAMLDHIIIKKAKVLETLGKTEVLCVDKTGILTSNSMVLERLYDGERTVFFGDEELGDRSSMALRLAALCSTLDNDATETAVETASLNYNKQSKTDIENIFPRVAVVPFSADRKTMTSINVINNEPVAIVKGAVENVVLNCSGTDTAKILEVAEDMSKEGLRVICVAIKTLSEIPANPHPDDIECNLNFVALLGLKDPPREGAVKGIRLCNTAGIKTVMMTGDNINTAVAVAKQVGILRDESEAVSGDDLSAMTDDELKEKIGCYSVFARITPGDKLRIIKAWQENGKYVTVTGDHLEDADALNIADAGCAMGEGGTAVARGNADIIIEDGNFYLLADTIKQSRGMFANIRKVVAYLLSCNISEILFFVIALSIFGFSPLTASALLWINLLTDTSPALSLALEKAENKVMKKRPAVMHGSLFDFGTIVSVFAQSLFLTLTAIITFIIGLNAGKVTAITMAFATVSISQIIHTYNLKSEGSIFKADFKSNKFMNLSSILLLFTSLFLVLTPAGSVFGLTVLTAGQIFTSIGLSILIIPFSEALKLILKKTGF